MTTREQAYWADAEELRDRLHALVVSYPYPVAMACLGAQVEALILTQDDGVREGLRFIYRLSQGVLSRGDDDE